MVSKSASVGPHAPVIDYNTLCIRTASQLTIMSLRINAAAPAKGTPERDPAISKALAAPIEALRIVLLIQTWNTDVL